MAMHSSGNKGLFTEINITPLQTSSGAVNHNDVIAPMFQSIDNNIVLPSINSGLSVDEKEVTVAITKEAKFYVNSEPLMNPAFGEASFTGRYSER